MRVEQINIIISLIYQQQSANELKLVLPNIDLTKLSKLRQRLVAPSEYNTQYLFPGNQAFFRDFITSCESHAIFMEQLKLVLIAELLDINESSVTTNTYNQTKDKSTEFIVSIKCYFISYLIIKSKFRSI